VALAPGTATAAAVVVVASAAAVRRCWRASPSRLNLAVKSASEAGAKAASVSAGVDRLAGGSSGATNAWPRAACRSCVAASCAS
jgi:hypothetical protein